MHGTIDRFIVQNVLIAAAKPITGNKINLDLDNEKNAPLVKRSQSEKIGDGRPRQGHSFGVTTPMIMKGNANVVATTLLITP